MTRRLLLVWVSLGLAACASAPPAESAATDDPPASSSGGEAAPAPEEPEPEPAPAVIRSTIPVPVPQPAVPRDALSPQLEAVWTEVEEQVQLTRPPGPEDNTRDNVQAWADGPFLAWIEARRDALTRTRARLAEVAAEPPYERALALALFAYAFEDFGAQIGGAPVPDDIATRDDLRRVYIASLNEATVPLGQRAIELYADCQSRLAALGDDSPWLPWRAYCVQRGQEVIEGYGLSPAEPAAEPAEPEPEAEGNPTDL